MPAAAAAADHLQQMLSRTSQPLGIGRFKMNEMDRGDGVGDLIEIEASIVRPAAQASVRRNGAGEEEVCRLIKKSSVS